MECLFIFLCQDVIIFEICVQLGVGREILQALERAFQLHQGTDYQVSQVNTFP